MPETTIPTLNVTAADVLAERLREAARTYYLTDEVTMSDEEFDAGVDALRALMDSDPEAADRYTDLTDRVGFGQAKAGDVTHESMMGSLDKAKTLAEVEELVRSVAGTVVLEPKLDGLAVRARYESGRLTLVATRGDGRTGEDITDRIVVLRPTGLPLTSLSQKPLEVRGEVFLTDRAFALAQKVRLAARGVPFANPRNAAAGILRKGDERYAGLLSFIAYDVEAGSYTSHGERLAIASLEGVETVDRLPVPALHCTFVVGPSDDRVRVVLEQVEAFGQGRADLGFPTDGLVIKADDDRDREALGDGSRAPRWALAYKYPGETARTQVVAITTDVGRTGRLSIRVEVTPVLVDGTTITYLTGHNVAWMAQKDVRVGDTIVVRRAGDVIPYIDQVDLTARPTDTEQWAPPTLDPNGGEWDKSTLLWRSTDPALSVGSRLRYAVSRDALDIEGLGTEVIDALVEQNLATRLADLWDLTPDTLANLTLAQGRRLGEKNATKIVAEIDQARTAPWHRVITALGLRMTGRTMSRRLAKAFPNMDLLLAARVSDLAEVEGVGTVKAQVIYDELRALIGDGDNDRESSLTALAEAGVTMGEEPAKKDGPGALDGITVVVSGSVPGYSRTGVTELIEAHGGRASSSVSASTTLLVSEPSTSSKYVKAVNLGVRIVTPAEFLGMI